MSRDKNSLRKRKKREEKKKKLSMKKQQSQTSGYTEEAKKAGQFHLYVFAFMALVASVFIIYSYS